MLAILVATTRNVRPETIDMGFPRRLALLMNRAIPKAVENSATAFEDAPITSLLRISIPRKATPEVVAAEERPKMSNERTMGTPVRSNLSWVSHGKGIFKPENFSV